MVCSRFVKRGSVTIQVSDASFGGTFSSTYSSKNLPPNAEIEGFVDKVKIEFSSNDDGDVGSGVGIFWTSTDTEITTKSNSREYLVQ